LSWRRKQHIEGELRNVQREFQMVGATTAKLRETKHVRTGHTRDRQQIRVKNVGAKCAVHFQERRSVNRVSKLSYTSLIFVSQDDGTYYFDLLLSQERRRVFLRG